MTIPSSCPNAQDGTRTHTTQPLMLVPPAVGLPVRLEWTEWDSNPHYRASDARASCQLGYLSRLMAPVGF